MKSRVAYLIAKLSPRFFFKIAYFHNRRRRLNLDNPKDLSALWIKKLLSGKINDNYRLADKYLVRQYVVDRGLGSILPTLIGVYDTPKDILYTHLPNRFAIKMNYGAGMNIICRNKAQLNILETNKKLSYWLNKSEYSLAERHYNLISRKIIIEEFIEDGAGGFPIDYKFICINGKVTCCLVCSNREAGHANYLPYDLNWNPKYEWIKSTIRADNIKLIPCPSNLSEMIKVAEILSSGIDMVRIDLYSDGNRIWFGEITLTPSGCIFHRWSNKAMDELGKLYLKNCNK